MGIKLNKASGLDGIPTEAIREAGKVAPEWLKAVLNKVLMEQCIPCAWKTARLSLIPKGTIEHGKYRSICLLNEMDKVYEALIRNRLEQEIKAKEGLAERQFGFRKGRSTIQAVKEMVTMPRNIKWAVVVTLDVKNAFNSIPWCHIREEMMRRGISRYLYNVINDYLSDRKLWVEKEVIMEVSAGVPQGSILGPTLWNLIYDGVLNLGWPEGVKAVGFADDLAVVATAETKEVLVEITEDALLLIDEWMLQKHLELEPSKTEAVMIRGNRKKRETFFRQRGIEIHPKKAIKYLGVWIDDVGNFGRHVEETVRKADRRARELGWLMPNIGGPTYRKRRVIQEVVASTILYPAPVWQSAMQIGRYKTMLERTQRKSLIRLVSAYRTISTAAVQVIAGVIPIHLLIRERTRLEGRMDRKQHAVKVEERRRTLNEWQGEWDSNETTAQWTKSLIRNVERWVGCHHRSASYYLSQALSGHGSFRTYTRRIGKTEDDECYYCGETDTAAHTIFSCPRWNGERDQLVSELGEQIGVENLIQLMMTNEGNWKAVEIYVGRVMKIKEEEERGQQRE